jgi:guanylate kinase
VLVNRDLDKSFARLRAILTAERLRRVLKPSLEGFVDGLLADLRKIG